MDTVMYQIKCSSTMSMMCFVIITKNNNAIVIDGGRSDDIENLKDVLGGRHISAWILTHPHADHVSGFINEINKNGGVDFDFDKVCYNFPDYDILSRQESPWPEYYNEEINEMIPKFNDILPMLGDRACVVTQGEVLQVDEVKIEFLYTCRPPYPVGNPINDSSMVFKLTTPNKSVVFLGDIGPEAGDRLFHESHDKLKADMVQMAHHGLMCCDFNVYMAISPKECMWCAPAWLMDEPTIVKHLSDYDLAKSKSRTRLYGTELTKKWMDILGVEKHHISATETIKHIL